MRPSLLLRAKNLFEVALKLPDFGKGQRLQRAKWKENCYWTLTAVQPSPDGAHGKAFGILTWNGQPQNEQSKRVNGTLKRAWKSMDRRDIEWVSLEKPPLQQEPAAGATSAEAP